MQKNLPRAFIYKGVTYGPGLTEVPDDVLNSKALTPAFRDALFPKEVVTEDATTKSDNKKKSGDKPGAK